jgi:hypothetical protein
MTVVLFYNYKFKRRECNNKQQQQQQVNIAKKKEEYETREDSFQKI